MKWLYYGATAVVIAVFLAVSLQHLALPGLYYDEAISTAVATNFIHHISLANMPGFAYTITVLGHNFIAMNMSYFGALKMYVVSPILLAGGSYVTVRAATLVIAAAALLLFAFFLAQTRYRNFTPVFVLLLAMDTSYILYNRTDWGPVSLSLLLEMLTLYCSTVWVTRRSSWALWVVGVALGLGLWDKVNFLWFIVAVGASAGYVQFVAKRTILSLRDVVIVATGMTLGSLPFWIFNLQNHFSTFATAVTTGPYPGLLASLAERIQLLNSVLSGVAVPLFQFGTYYSPFTTIGPWLFWPSLLLVAGLLVTKPRRLGLVGATAVIAFVVIFLETVVTPQAAGKGHDMMFIYPFPQVIEGVALMTVWEWRRVTLRVALVGVLAWCALSNGLAINDYYTAVVSSGGIGNWSNASGKLAGYLLKVAPRTHKRIYALDWGFSNELIVLSKGRLQPEDIFYPALWGQTIDFSQFHLRGALILLHTPSLENFPIPERQLRSYLRHEGWHLQLLRRFSQGTGKPIYEVYFVATG